MRRDLEEVWPTQGPVHADILQELGLALADLRSDEAVQHWSAGASFYAATVESDYIPLARTRFALARALVASDPVGARRHAEQALDAFHASARADEVRAVESWLAGRD